MTKEQEMIRQLRKQIRELEKVNMFRKKTIKHQGEVAEERHNVLCEVKEVIDKYFIRETK